MSKHLRIGARTQTPPQNKATTVPKDSAVSELLDRTRRIETRLTKYIEDQGITTNATRAKWRGIREDWEAARLLVPSPSTALKDILAVIPAGWEDEVDLYVGEELIATIYR